MKMKMEKIIEISISMLCHSSKDGDRQTITISFSAPYTESFRM